MNARNRTSASCNARSRLPRRVLLDLLDYLEEHLANDACDHSHRHTMACLAGHGVEIPPALMWLMSLGGDCDCTVLEQVEHRAFE